MRESSSDDEENNGDQWRLLEWKSPPTFRKHKRGRALKASQKQLALNVYAKLVGMYPDMNKKEISRKASDLTGIGGSTIIKIRKEKDNGKLRTLGKQHPKLKGRKIRMEKMDSFDKVTIRRLVHSFFRRNTVPTISMMKDAIEEEELPNMSRATVQRVLRDLGFRYCSSRGSHNAYLIERHEIQLSRVKYLREIKKAREEKQNIFYLDETCINYGPKKSTVGDAFMQDLTTGLCKPSSGGGRFIIFHIGSEKGFLQGGLYYFRGSKGLETDGHTFEAWFHNILGKLPTNSLIIMDNAPYHSVKAHKMPTLRWQKADIIEWLQEKSIPFPQNSLKVELMEIVKREKHRFDGYKVDEMAAAAGHRVLRLPPYHCELNPIEMIWKQLKEYVAKYATFEDEEVEKRMLEGVSSMTPYHWANYCAQVKKLEEEWLCTEEIYHEKMFCTNTEESTSSDESRSSEDEDFTFSNVTMSVVEDGLMESNVDSDKK